MVLGIELELPHTGSEEGRMVLGIELELPDTGSGAFQLRGGSQA